ncbi:FemAB family XrtA/PEP-CTERM system-associated protein [Desulfogranum marinum]|uniref:FemAB family XrtA/PEP-CTERM system-associated protein n=1 Tax=Desulfogranum marinum TaxID=453220 RepID=UPI0029C7CB27|nr:FemAB family XrtA/PEP-CTERM system-associated protein [Desulfogranum marinum]
MKGKIEIHNGEFFDEWNSFVNDQSEARIENLYEWKNILRDSYNLKSFYIYSTGIEGNIEGILPLFQISSVLFGRHLVSMPFLDYGGILSVDKNVSQKLHEYAANIAKDTGSHDLIYRHSQKKISECSTYENKVSFLMELDRSESVLWQRIGSERRNRIKKANKLGLSVSYGKKSDLDVFYKIWSANMRDLGSPVHSKRFFNSILEYLPENSGIILVRDVNDTVIASGLYLKYKETVSLPWVSSRKKFFHLYPNILLYWHLMADHGKVGYRLFDFGRSSINSGTYHFKKRWKAKRFQLCWEIMSLNNKSTDFLNQDSESFAPMITCWKHTPVWITNIIGPYLRKNLIN